MLVGKGQLDGAFPVGACKRESVIDTQGVEKGETCIRGLVKIGGRLALLPGAEEPGGVYCGVGAVKVTYDQIGVVDVQKGQVSGKWVRGIWERSGLRIANPRPRTGRAKTTLWLENI